MKNKIMKLLKEYGKNKSNLESEALREMLADDIIAIVIADNFIIGQEDDGEI